MTRACVGPARPHDVPCPHAASLDGRRPDALRCRRCARRREYLVAKAKASALRLRRAGFPAIAFTLDITGEPVRMMTWANGVRWACDAHGVPVFGPMGADWRDYVTPLETRGAA